MLTLIEESPNICSHQKKVETYAYSHLSRLYITQYFLCRFHVLHIGFFMQAHRLHIVCIYLIINSFSACFRFDQ